MIESYHSTWLEIDLGAIKNNVRQIRAITNRPVLAVVKANAYGHGLVAVARAAQEAGATWLGVARVAEGLALRAAGNTGKILVTGYTPPQFAPQAALADISITIYDPHRIGEYVQALRQNDRPLNVHVKVDTGMGRLGIFSEDGLEFIDRLGSAPGLHVEGLFTHFAQADQPQHGETTHQIARFDRLIAELSQRGLRPDVVHASNSAGLLYFPAARYDLVRAGIIIYGLNPSADAPAPPAFLPAFSLKSTLVSIKQLPAGHGVGYNQRYKTESLERIGVIAIGYADGFRRRLGGVALVRGKRVPILGTVCMDQCMLQLDGVPDAEVGDEVVLIGSQGPETISVDELAGLWGTINYEVVCAIAERVPRVYLP